MHNNKMRRFVSLFLSVLILAAFPVLSAVTASAEVIGLRAGETYYLRNVATGKYMDVYNQEKRTVQISCYLVSTGKTIKGLRWYIKGTAFTGCDPSTQAVIRWT